MLGLTGSGKTSQLDEGGLSKPLIKAFKRRNAKDEPEASIKFREKG